jgi:hypothetical protein
MIMHSNFNFILHGTSLELSGKMKFPLGDEAEVSKEQREKDTMWAASMYH